MRRRAASGNGYLDAYLASLPRHAPLGRDEERYAAWRWINDGDEDARDTLIERNLPFVVLVAKEYVGKGLPVDELVAEGNVALVQAAKYYDPARGARFVSFARIWIEQAIRRALFKAITTSHYCLDEAAQSYSNGVHEVDYRDTALAVTNAIDRIDSLRDREILRYRLGLYDGNQWSLRETAGAVGLTAERVRQVEKEYLDGFRARHLT